MWLSRWLQHNHSLRLKPSLFQFIFGHHAAEVKTLDIAENSSRDPKFGPFIPTSCVILILSIILSYFIYGNTTDGFKNALAFILSFVGVAVSTLGFYFTILQISKVATASIASTQAVQSLKKQFRSFEITSEVNRMLAISSLSIEVIKEKKWNDAANKLGDLRVCLVRLAAFKDENIEVEIEQIKDWQSTILGLQIILEDLTDGDEYNPTEARKSIREINDFALTHSIKFKEAVGVN